VWEVHTSRGVISRAKAAEACALLRLLLLVVVVRAEAPKATTERHGEWSCLTVKWFANGYVLTGGTRGTDPRVAQERKAQVQRAKGQVRTQLG